MRKGGTSTEWRKIRGVVFRTMGDVCVMCGEKATDIDHIIELDAGGTDDIENLQPLCNPCHKAKTAAYNSKRMSKRAKTVENTGFFYRDAPPPTLSLSYLSPRLTVEPPIAQKRPERAN